MRFEVRMIVECDKGAEKYIAQSVCDGLDNPTCVKFISVEEDMIYECSRCGDRFEEYEIENWEDFDYCEECNKEWCPKKCSNCNEEVDEDSDWCSKECYKEYWE